MSHSDSEFSTDRTNMYLPINKFSKFLPCFDTLVRLVFKSKLKKYVKNSQTECSVNLTFIDATGEINCTLYGEECSRFFHQLHQGRVYSLKYIKAMFKKNDREMRNLKHLLQMSFTPQTLVIDQTAEKDAVLPRYNVRWMTRVEDIGTKSMANLVDVMGICFIVEDTTNFESKKGNSFVKRDIWIADEHQNTISLVLWGEDTDIDISVGQVLFISNVKISEYLDVKSLGFCKFSRIETNPDHPIVEHLNAFVSDNLDIFIE